MWYGVPPRNVAVITSVPSCSVSNTFDCAVSYRFVSTLTFIISCYSAIYFSLCFVLFTFLSLFFPLLSFLLSPPALTIFMLLRSYHGVSTRICAVCRTGPFSRAGMAVRNGSDSDVIYYLNRTRLPVFGTES